MFLSSDCGGNNSLWSEGADGTIRNEFNGLLLNIDGNRCTPGVLVKVFHQGNRLAFEPGSSEGEGSLRVGSDVCQSSCLNNGSGAAVPPERAKEQVLPGQVKLAPCGGAEAAGWERRE